MTLEETSIEPELSEVGADVLFNTHSTVWTEHGGAAPVPPDRHTAREKQQQTLKEIKSIKSLGRIAGENTDSGNCAVIGSQRV